MLEEVIAYHCAPALAGIKPSNLITCSKKDFPMLLEQINILNDKLNQKDIYFLPLLNNSERVLLLVYRKEKLLSYIFKKEMKEFLISFGYNMDESFEEIFSVLKKRLKESKNFPHEIGAFLGYPIEDINGYLTHCGKNYDFSGYWKVYANAEKARALFEQFNRCRAAVYKRIVSGIPIAKLFNAA